MTYLACVGKCVGTMKAAECVFSFYTHYYQISAVKVMLERLKFKI